MYGEDYGFLVYLALAIGNVTYAAVKGDNSWRVTSEPQTLVFRKPLLKRTAGLSIVLLLLVSFHEMLRSAGPSSTTSTQFLLLMYLLIGLMAVALMGLAQPEQLRLDLQRQTYRCTRGWPLFRRQWTGEFSDFTGLDVNIISNLGSGTHFYTRLLWKTPANRTFTLGIFGTQEEAKRLAEEIRAELWGQAVPAPNQWRHSST